ncbi:MAG TPA: TonB family protein [Gammaproteobacteria bacterium]|jgi:TonB family protein
MLPKLKSSLIPLLCGLLAACATGPKAPVLAAAPAAQPSVPALIATPVIDSAPASIEARVPVQQDAFMLLSFMVQPDGSVRGAQIMSSELPEDTSSAVLGAFGALKFQAFVDGGKPVSHPFTYPLFFGPDAVPDRTRYLCEHAAEVYKPRDRCDMVTQGTWRVYRITPPYPDSMLSTPVAGQVTLSFDLDQSGVPSNVKVLRADPPGVFDTAAVVALQQWYFEPLDGPPPAALQHASVTLNFKPPSGGY